MNFHIAKKYIAQKAVVTSKRKYCFREFLGFYALRQYKKTQHGFPIKIAKVDLDEIIKEVDVPNLKEELRSCQHFLVYSELERTRHNVINYAVENLNETIVNDKSDHFFNISKSAAKLNVAFRFIFKK